MFVLLVLYRVWPGWSIVVLPVWLVILMFLAFGLGLVTASWMVTYRRWPCHSGYAILGLFISPVAWSYRTRT